MKKLWFLISFLIISATAYKSYYAFHQYVVPKYASRCAQWGGKAQIHQDFELKCINKNNHFKALEIDYLITADSTAAFFGIVLLFSFLHVFGKKRHV